jgi:D-3-phosphoglycerate dehydrogenase / 2-oxoglutarate reductase
VSLDILLLEDVHASATPILESIPGAAVERLRHAPAASELGPLLAGYRCSACVRARH